MIEINLLPDSERTSSSRVQEINLSIGKNSIDWLTLAPKILGGLWVLLLVVSVVFLYLPNFKRAKEQEKLQQEWKLLEPNYTQYQEKEKEVDKITGVLDEFYRFIDERAIWSRNLFILAKNLPSEINVTRITAKDKEHKFDFIERVSVEDEKGNKKIVEKIFTKTKLVHSIEIKGLVPIDGQSKVILFKKNLEKDDFLKDVLISVKIPGITVTSSRYKSFTLELAVGDVKESRE